jgi:hypothetical protein
VPDGVPNAINPRVRKGEMERATHYAPDRVGGKASRVRFTDTDLPERQSEKTGRHVSSASQALVSRDRAAIAHTGPRKPRATPSEMSHKRMAASRQHSVSESVVSLGPQESSGLQESRHRSRPPISGSDLFTAFLSPKEG